MLGDRDAWATLPVADLDTARRFYEETLGLTPEVDQSPGAVLYASGGTKVLVYQSEYAGTNGGTAAAWAAGDGFDGVVDALRGKGVTFEHYDLPGTTRDGDVHEMGGIRGVWFKDPDGNILNVVSM